VTWKFSFRSLFELLSSFNSYPAKGLNGIFVVVETGPRLEDKLKGLPERYWELRAPYFQKVNPPKRISLFNVAGQSEKAALIFKCENYNGNLPKDPEKY
jgi:hypothetical protein